MPTDKAPISEKRKIERKVKNRINVTTGKTVRFPAEIEDAIRKLAASKGMNASTFVRVMIDDFLRRRSAYKRVFANNEPMIDLGLPFAFLLTKEQIPEIEKVAQAEGLGVGPAVRAICIAYLRMHQHI